MCDSGSRRRRGSAPDPSLDELVRRRKHLSVIGEGYAAVRPMLRDGWRFTRALWWRVAITALVTVAWQERRPGFELLERLVAVFH